MKTISQKTQSILDAFGPLCLAEFQSQLAQLSKKDAKCKTLGLVGDYTLEGLALIEKIIKGYDACPDADDQNEGAIKIYRQGLKADDQLCELIANL